MAVNIVFIYRFSHSFNIMLGLDDAVEMMPAMCVNRISINNEFVFRIRRNVKQSELPVCKTNFGKICALLFSGVLCAKHTNATGGL